MPEEGPFFSVTTILGTALAICVIMVMAIVFKVQNEGFKPELNRGWALYVKDVAIMHKNEEDGGMSHSLVGNRVVKERFFTLRTPEAVSMQSMRMQTPVTSTDQTRRMRRDQVWTDEDFWKIFNFGFLAGKPSLRGDVESNIKEVVINCRLALYIFGLADESVIRQTILVTRRPYVVGGIMEDVSPLVNRAYAQIWIPYAQSDAGRLINEETLEGLIGSHRVLTLARPSGDFNKTKTEVEQSAARSNNSLQELKIDLMKRPDMQMESRPRLWSNVMPDVPRVSGQYVSVSTILLLVPAVDLSGLTTSRTQKRMGELRVREALDVSRGTLIRQVLAKNLAVTLLSGVSGLLFSYVAVSLLKDWLLGSFELASLSSGLTLSTGVLTRPAIFFFAFLFCLLSSLLNAAILAWNASSGNIVNSLNDK